MGVGARNGFVTPAMARKGDGIVMTKGAAIETVGQLGVLFAGRISRALGSDIARHAAGLFDQMSVVRDAAVASGFGLRDNGVTAMHDATERGVWGGLVEIAQASGTGLIVEQAAVPVSREVRAVCDLFEIDLYSASSEGTLLLTCTPTRVASLLDWFDAHGIHAAHIGHMTPAEEGIRVVRHGQEQPLRMPDRDPFWPALPYAEWKRTHESTAREHVEHRVLLGEAVRIDQRDRHTRHVDLDARRPGDHARRGDGSRGVHVV